MEIRPLVPLSITGDFQLEKGQWSTAGKEKICQAFEEIFVSKLFSSMAITSPLKQDTASATLLHEWSWTMLGDAIGQQVAERGAIGLGKHILEQLAQEENPGSGGSNK